MKQHGKIALFCSRDFILGSRLEYGGGFFWCLSDDEICLEMFWVTGDVPGPIRVHLFGDTPSESPDHMSVSPDDSHYRRAHASDHRDGAHRSDSDGGAEKIFRLAIEVQAPEVLRIAEKNILHRRTPILFQYESIADTNNDFDFFQDTEEINIEP